VSSVDEQVADLKQKIADATRDRVRREGERDAAKRALERCFEILRDDFGVETKEMAQAALESLENDLEAEVDQIRQALEEAGG